jgi:hypothetical protein
MSRGSVESVSGAMFAVMLCVMVYVMVRALNVWLS